MDNLKKLGKYQIKATLGKGAMGVVFKGFDPVIERTVAIKTIRKDALNTKELAPLLARFKREAQAAGRLTHPSIVTVYEYGEEQNTAFIAMEYVDGCELKEFLDNNEKFSFETTVDITNQLLSALAYSHKKGVIHRDIKPGNILVLEDGHIKITDFGIARIESSNLTQFGDVMGTPSYMSPEQFMGQQVDKRSDIFSTGVILYHLLTGEKPFPGNSITTIMHRVMNSDPPRASDLNFQVPAGFDSIISKALAKKPAERFQSAEDFLAALRHVNVDGKKSTNQSIKQPIKINRDDATVHMPGETGQTPAKPEHIPSAAPQSKSFSWTLTFLVILILSASSFLVWKIYSEQLSIDDMKLLLKEKQTDLNVLIGGEKESGEVHEISQSSKKKPGADTVESVTKKEEVAVQNTKRKAKKVKLTTPAKAVATQLDQPVQAVSSASSIKPQPSPRPAILKNSIQPSPELASSPKISEPKTQPETVKEPEPEKEYSPNVLKPAPGRMLKESEW